ncbi:hypothetical protein IST495B_01810 [Burkholderia multivorans]|nr:hypothetical protein IST495B_01810 [Burkholderia multivorans]
MQIPSTKPIIAVVMSVPLAFRNTLGCRSERIVEQQLEQVDEMLAVRFVEVGCVFRRT